MATPVKQRTAGCMGRHAAALLFASFATTIPAQAEVESVAPIDDGGIWLFWDPSAISPRTSSPDVACNSGYNYQWNITHVYTYVGSVPNQYGYANLGYRDCKFLDTRTGRIVDMGSIQRVPFPPPCPTPVVNPTVPYSYNLNNGMCEREAQCVAPNVINPSNGKCELPCPVLPLNNPPFTAACSTSLDEGRGVDINNKCGTLREPDMVAAAECIAKKIRALSSPPVNYNGPSATVRTAEYQNHLREIWDKSSQLSTIMNSVVFTAETKQACMRRKAEIDAELQDHAIDSQPSSSGEAAPHVERRAIDVPRAVARELMRQVTLYTTTNIVVNGRIVPTRAISSDVEDYIHSATVNPPACSSGVSWGGRFDPVDRVHFQLPD